MRIAVPVFDKDVTDQVRAMEADNDRLRKALKAAPHPLDYELDAVLVRYYKEWWSGSRLAALKED